MYKFYPTLLDKFSAYLDVDIEHFFFQDDKGVWKSNYDSANDTYIYSQEEIDVLAIRDLIDTINRVEREPNIACARGTALNEVVDCLIHNRKSENDSVKICKTEFNGVKAIKAICDGFEFLFDIPFCKSVAEYFKGSLSQVFTSATIDTKFGEVELYGYIDELRENKVFDLKTTSRYEFGKYAKYWQRHAYPYTLIESGMCTEINSFEFTAYALKGGTSRTPLITGVQYPEVYQYNHEQSKVLLKEICERFCEFLEENRSLITNKKIFNEE